MWLRNMPHLGTAVHGYLQQKPRCLFTHGICVNNISVNQAKLSSTSEELRIDSQLLVVF